MDRKKDKRLTIENSILFRNMTGREIDQIIGMKGNREEAFEKNTFIVREGELLLEMALVLSGTIQLFHTDINGNNNLLEILGPGDTLGMLNAVGNYKLHISARTLERTVLLFLRTDSLLRDHELTEPAQIRFLQNLTLALAQKAHRLTVKLEESVRRTTRERIQDYLSSQYHKSGTTVFSIPLNRQELADFLFVDRSAMSNELCKMRDEGLIKFEKSNFELLVKMPITEEEPDPNEESER